MFRLIKRLITFTVSLSVFSISALFFLVLYLKSQPLPPSSIEETTIIYSSEGEIIDTLYRGINRQLVELNQIPNFIEEATIAIEDRRFYEHYGIDLFRLFQAIIVDIKEMRKAQGASTITQQLAKNLYLSNEKTWQRKIQEAMLTIQLEMNYSKPEILEMYLNQIYYGNSAYGIQSAALTYFGKPAAELTLAEGTLLVGIPKGPTYYEPYNNWESAKNRQKLILDAMVEAGFIARSEAQEAYEEETKLIPKNQRIQTTIAPYFRDAVLQEVRSQFTMSQEELAQAGLKIYTTLSIEMQQKAEAIVAKNLPKDQPLQAALVAMEPKTGNIRAMVGGRDYKESQFNRAYAERQPGSSFKPFLYLTALENGMTALTEIESKPTVFTYDDDKVYAPKNYADRYANAYITMIEAIKKSDNIYAVSTNLAIGEEKVVERAKEFGIASNLQPLPSLALGSQPISPLNMVKGYAMLANLGEKVEPILITKIENSKGEIVFEQTPAKTRVADPRQVFILQHMLQGVFDEGGTGNRVVSLLNRPVAGKTGTTPMDAWMIGFTPQLAAAVWVGFDQDRELSIVESHVAAPIWAEFMESALADEPPMLFPVPEGLTSVYIDPTTNKLATADCPESELVYFIPGTEPKEYCSDHPTDANGNPAPPVEEKRSLWERFKRWWEH